MADSAGSGPGAQYAQRLERVGEQLRALLARPDVAQRVHDTPSAGDWSALQTVGHMAEMIPYWLKHCADIIAAAGAPHRFGRALDDPERLAGVERAKTGDPAQLLRQLDREIQAAAATLRAMPAGEFARVGQHSTRGEMTVEQIAEQLLVGHAEAHVEQVRAALEV